MLEHFTKGAPEGATYKESHLSHQAMMTRHKQAGAFENQELPADLSEPTLSFDLLKPTSFSNPQTPDEQANAALSKLREAYRYYHRIEAEAAKLAAAVVDSPLPLSLIEKQQTLSKTTIRAYTTFAKKCLSDAVRLLALDKTSRQTQQQRTEKPHTFKASQPSNYQQKTGNMADVMPLKKETNSNRFAQQELSSDFQHHTAN